MSYGNDHLDHEVANIAVRLQFLEQSITTNRTRAGLIIPTADNQQEEIGKLWEAVDDMRGVLQDQQAAIEGIADTVGELLATKSTVRR